jgi:hypothetical protein
MGIVHDDAVGNILLWINTGSLLESHDEPANRAILAIMTRIRTTITQVRDINNLSVLFAQQTELMKDPTLLEAASRLVIPGPGHMTVNSVWR